MKMKSLVVAAALALAPAASAQIPGLGNLKGAADKAAKKVEKDAQKEADKTAKDAKKDATKAADAAAKEAAKEVKEAVKVDVVDTAVALKFTRLAAALQAAGLIEELKKPGPFTIFAPTDEAFGKLKAEDLTALMADKEKLTKVLKAHVVSGKVMAKDVKTMKAKTLAGDVDVEVKDGKVTFGGAHVTSTDVDCTNGVIHVIDTVVMPK